MDQVDSTTSSSNSSAAELLRRLRSSDPGPAWVEFIDRYSRLIMNTANQFEYGTDRIDECFIYVCEKLNDHGFRRLLKFNPRGGANFSTWLATVVFNLCVDWHRKEFGRVTQLPAITALPSFDQLVYRIIVEQGVSKETCYQMLRSDMPELTRDMVQKSAGRVVAVLTPRQRWKISVRNRGRRRPHSLNDDSNPFGQLVDPGASPEAAEQQRQELEALQQAMLRLDADQRLILQLRFQEGLSLKRIARLRNLGDSSRAWRHLQAAVNALSEELQSENSAVSRKN